MGAFVPQLIHKRGNISIKVIVSGKEKKNNLQTYYLNVANMVRAFVYAHKASYLKASYDTTNNLGCTDTN